jgi:hypothetical protein
MSPVSRGRCTDQSWDTIVLRIQILSVMIIRTIATYMPLITNPIGVHCSLIILRSTG